MVAAALLGEEERGMEASALLARASTLMAPSHWKAELANVIWKAIVFGKAGGVDRIGALLEAAESLAIASVDVSELWRGAVARAVGSSHPAYDTLFVELAVREGVPLASYDRALRGKFPAVVHSPSSLLHRART